MSKFKGTINEYHKFIGPRIRNVVQSITKKAKKDAGNICEKCKKELELEAAHIHGKERKQIIEAILNPFLDSLGIIEINLEEIEKEIKERHYPLDKTFKFLCKSCHKEYDDINSFQNKNIENEIYKQFKTENMKTKKVTNELTNKDFIWRLLQSNKSKLESLPKVIDKLLKEKYCKENFNLYYPLLRKIEVGISEEEKQRLYLRMDGRSGYYKDDYKISESRFIVCSEWYPKRYPDQRINTEKWFHLLEQEKPDNSNEDDRINNENLREEFYNWIIIVRGLEENTAQARLNNFLRICEHEGDIDVLYEGDQCRNLLDRLTYGVEDQRNNNPVQHNVPIKGDIRNGTATLKSTVQLYINFRNENN